MLRFRDCHRAPGPSEALALVPLLWKGKEEREKTRLAFPVRHLPARLYYYEQYSDLAVHDFQASRSIFRKISLPMPAARVFQVHAARDVR